MDYKGYKLMDEIMLICREPASKKPEDYYQAYLVDPSNKNQIESARYWAKWTEYGPSFRNEETGTWEREYTIEHNPAEFTFENAGFKLELLDCAGGSSQGGKLSFWNCFVYKDDKKFKIGINSEMLLALLKESNFSLGICDAELIFITQKGRVGLTTKGSATYEQCLRDKEAKEILKTKAVTKFNFGDKIATTTMEEVYLGEVLKFYEFDIGNNYSRWARDMDLRDCTLIKLKKPKKVCLTDVLVSYYNISSITDIIKYYTENTWSFPDIKASRPKRVITGNIELDASASQLYEVLFNKVYDYSELRSLLETNEHIKIKAELCSLLSKNSFGLNTETFDIPEDVLAALKYYGVKIVEEE